MDGVDWSSKLVRTGGLSGPLHEEWALSIRIDCDGPVRGAPFADLDGVRWHARDRARRAERVVQLQVGFTAHDWAHSDVVQVSAPAGGIGLNVESAQLKSDPVAATRVDVEPGGSGWTGVPMAVLSVPAAGLSVGVLLVRSVDTQSDRTRWRVRDEHTSGLGDFSFVETGERAGYASLGHSRRLRQHRPGGGSAYDLYVAAVRSRPLVALDASDHTDS